MCIVRFKNGMPMIYKMVSNLWIVIIQFNNLFKILQFMYKLASFRNVVTTVDIQQSSSEIEGTCFVFPHHLNLRHYIIRLPLHFETGYGKPCVKIITKLNMSRFVNGKHKCLLQAAAK